MKPQKENTGIAQTAMQTAHLAIDLGASSGRAILGILGGTPKLLELEELHRFEHAGVPLPTGPVWNLTDIWRNILIGLKKANQYCTSEDLRLASIGVDTWGVDWALLGPSGELLALPHCYRDPQNEPASQKALDLIGGFEELYSRTGIQLMPINTLFQVFARFEAEPALFEAAEQFLFLPDLIHFWLSGKVRVERTIASTSAMLSLETQTWDFWLLRKLGLPTSIFGPIVDSGTTVGTILKEIAEVTDTPKDLQVIAPGGHDTASAVAAVPAQIGEGWAYLSSGTWSLLGAEIEQPNTSPAAAAEPFTNELGVAGRVRFLKNITGLWMVQELRRELNEKEENEYDFAQLMEAARMAEPFRTLVDPNQDEFLAPGDMAEKIRLFAERSSQPVPETVGDLVRCSLESLALCYQRTLSRMESVLGCSFSVLHIVGGGCKNSLLNQLTSDALNRTVICGPGEATASGNVLVQAMGAGQIDSLQELRRVVVDSFEPVLYEPSEDREEWEAAIARFGNLSAPDPI